MAEGGLVEGQKKSSGGERALAVRHNGRGTHGGSGQWHTRRGGGLGRLRVARPEAGFRATAAVPSDEGERAWGTEILLKTRGPPTHPGSTPYPTPRGQGQGSFLGGPFSG